MILIFNDKDYAGYLLKPTRKYVNADVCNLVIYNIFKDPKMKAKAGNNCLLFIGTVTGWLGPTCSKPNNSN